MNQLLRTPATAFAPEELKTVLCSGLMSFPLTDFDADGEFDEAGYRARLEWLMPYGATVLFAAGGTGEAFSLTPAEQARVVRVAVDTCGTDTPIIAGAGYGTRLAIEMAQAAEAAGAAGVLLMPHYLTEANQRGISAHVEAVCRSVSIGVVVYNRNVCRLEAATVAELAERNPNLIGFKDGVGDIERLTRIYARLGDRLVYIGGLPTAETFALPLLQLGVSTYSSALYNFLPEFALRFYAAVRRQDRDAVYRMLSEFVLPYLDIRDRQTGYAVSIIKAGLTAVGRDGGPVRR